MWEEGTARQFSRFLVLLVAFAVLAACDTARVEELEAEVEDLRQQLDEATSTTSTTAPQKTIGVVSKSANITGVVTLRSGGFGPFGTTTDGRCWGIGAYEDVVAGTTILVRDSTGATIAASFLEDGVRSSDSCDLAFIVEVPTDVDSYTIEIKNVAGFDYSLVELDALGWVVELGLG